MASKRPKYLGVNLTEEEQSLDAGNYKTPLKETEDLNKWELLWQCPKTDLQDSM